MWVLKNYYSKNQADKTIKYKIGENVLMKFEVDRALTS